ncbi:class D sortase [Sedimentibacter hydroxybenzoicus DSM 7310]|uniref:Class D sortase n=1 Tax=Sedimentibacter hydroxybenzoicus DSM 7310 TaxID=1123245 RepID=A0A974BM96_SEDHY|nr:class D sortase [Sedimentibacter hydroxybenzoicus]NYB76004.1 class D sortase [Sedimentibacter hydroxybenzoicus DSM 7310]
MIRKYLAIVLILAGIAFIAIGLYQNFSTKYYQDKLVEEYDRHISMLNSDEEKEDVKEPVREVDAVEENEGVESTEEEASAAEEDTRSPVDKYLEGKEISGIIEIPKLNVRAAILEGTDDRALKYTVGHYPGTANPGEKGNSVLLGHRNYLYAHYFRRLNELNPGDEIIIRKDLDTYTYIVTESFVVSPQDVWVLDDTEDTIVTLITCTPIITYTDRLIVRGAIAE